MVMTEHDFWALARAERKRGREQVRQLTRQLAKDLGLPPDCMLSEAERDPHWQRDIREIRAQYRYGIGLVRPVILSPSEA